MFADWSQISLFFWEELRGDLRHLHLHIDQDSSCSRNRPTADQGWKILFPDLMESKKGPQAPKEAKGYKSAKTARPQTNPMWDAQFDDKSIFTSVRSLVEVLNQEPAKLATDRRDHDPSKRALACSATPVVCPSNNKVRDWTPFACWAFLEPIYVKRYRSDLFASVAGHLRFRLHSGLAPFVSADSQTRLGASGSVSIDSSYPWPDGIIITQDSLSSSALDVDISSMERSTRSRFLTEKHNKEIQRLITSWENSEVAHTDGGPPGSVDFEISRALNVLIQVCLIFLSYLFSLFDLFLGHRT